jgi:hypothetical protein
MPKPNGLSGVELTGATKEVRRLGLAEPTLVSRVVTRHSMSSQESLNLPNASFCCERTARQWALH